MICKKLLQVERLFSLQEHKFLKSQNMMEPRRLPMSSSEPDFRYKAVNNTPFLPDQVSVRYEPWQLSR